ncbi:MAG: hypothetical protein WCK75_00050 [Elusimicrobiota bacterium]
MIIKAGLIGCPLKKSFSPRLFRLFSDEPGGKYSYALMETGGPALARTLKKIKTLGWAGFNVTLPLKEKILPFLDSLSPEAKTIGAVNTVRIRHGKLEGHNTDAGALKLALKEAGCRLRSRTCVIWGAGGAARAAACVIGSAGAKAVDIHNRSFPRAAALVKYLSGVFPRTAFRARKLADVPVGAATLFVNATPLGMYKPLPVNMRFSGPAGSFYLDFAYARSLTPFLKNRAGRVISGIDLLIYQALKSSELYGGRRIKATEIVKLKDTLKARLEERVWP